ncbi:hypothetical protein B9Z19DRAFT_1083378 [Tuber borchii]|uniref:Uncharacterized protein n=1 Tax=Tuber borchii TaxID=42251 RepID=A0A2T6ZTE3_TUBBO|nr:hypothetical protein B9Z19DRAFT_1083378 [Tuber borchii]
MPHGRRRKPKRDPQVPRGLIHKLPVPYGAHVFFKIFSLQSLTEPQYRTGKGGMRMTNSRHPSHLGKIPRF